LKEIICKKNEINRDWPLSHHCLIFGGSILCNSDILASIPNLVNGSSLHLLNTKPDEISPHSLSEAGRVFDSIRRECLNFKECIRAINLNISPNSRQRWTTDTRLHPSTSINPSVNELGDLTQQLSHSLLTWSFQLRDLGTQFQEDNSLPADFLHPDYLQTRRRITVFFFCFGIE